MAEINKDILKIQFESECKVIDLRYEYPGFTGMEKYGIITKLSEKEIYEKYGSVVYKYHPFIVLSLSFGEIRREYIRNDDKFRKRQINNSDAYGYDDNLIEFFHPEIYSEDCCQEIGDKEELLENIGRLRMAVSKLTYIQKRHIVEHFIHGKSSRTIGKEEGISYQVVDRSIAAAVKKIKKFF